MRVAKYQYLFRYRPAQSISEFSAISGGQADQMLHGLGLMAWVMVNMMFAAKMECPDGDKFVFQIQDILMEIGVSGIVMIGMFEFNHFDNALVFFHHLGVGLSICMLIASVFQAHETQQRLEGGEGYGYYVVPIVLNVIAWPCCIIWFCITTKKRSLRFEPESEEERKLEPSDELKAKITKASMLNICLEGMAIYCTMLALSYHLIIWV